MANTVLNIEIEILEQISEEPWSLDRVLAMAEKYKEPWQVLNGLYGGQYINFFDEASQLLPEWKVLQLLRDQSLKGGHEKVFLMTSAKGRKYVYG